ncbi:MAG: ABC transporter ATP-binding protein [Epulopiscium sp.]|nr:ABC transporter ATP-binding protein [Candidatus Epulonipiscium sp.]
MILEVKNIHKSFSDTEVLHGISFSVSSGKALGFLGRNGAGKTTTIRILMDLFSPDKGEILLDGKRFEPKNHQIGYLPEERGLYPKQKVSDQLIYLGELRGLKRKAAKENTLFWLTRLGVEEYKEKKLETLSKGNQQKVQIAATLLCNPDIIILDEPFSGLDPVNAQILKDIITELIKENKLVIFSSHQMNYVEEFCEEIVLINKGEIVLTGNLKDIKREYGENQWIISDENDTAENLAKIFSQRLGHMIEIVEIRGEDLIIKSINNQPKNDVLREMIELPINIEAFSNYEPTLSDIFVLKAGDQE